jgi:LysR family transcriptional regulator, transcription activator of glutamate synthase operon
MELLQLHYFRTVARLEHVTRAAEELTVAQPALSKTIARLEAELGVSLFDRRGRRVSLNTCGRAFLRHVERIFMEMEEGRQELADLTGLERGTVTVAATTLRLLPDLLGAFLDRHPGINFRLSQASTAEMQAWLVSGEIDLCLASVPVTGSAIRSVALFTEEILLAVPPRHRLAGRGRIALGEVAAEPFISAKRGYWSRDLTDDACRQAGFIPDIICEGDEPGAIRNLVAAGLGVAFLPTSSRRAGAGPEVAWLHITEPVCQRTVSLVWREDRYLSAAVRRFQQFAVEYFAAVPEQVE